MIVEEPVIRSGERSVAGLCARLETRQAAICVVGLGYVGLPLAIALAEAGFPVRGLDVAADKVAQLQRGASYILDVPEAAVARQRQAGRFLPHTDPTLALAGAEV